MWWEGSSLIKNSNDVVENKTTIKIKNISSACCSFSINCNKAKKSKSYKIWELLEKYSDLKKLLRIAAYILRFVHKIIKNNKKFSKKFKIKIKKSELFSNDWFNLEYDFGIVKDASVNEINRARLFWIYLVQKTYFYKEFRCLKNKKSPQLHRDSPLLALDPFINNNLLRLGGRIHNSLLSYDQKHPFLLPFESKFTQLLVEFTHLQTKHGTLKLTL